jgi:hypothetical protein
MNFELELLPLLPQRAVVIARFLADEKYGFDFFVFQQP